MRIARRMAHISPFRVMSILKHAKQMEQSGIDIIHMEIGEPDFSTPEPVVASAVDAINAKQTFYSEANGMLVLREKIAAYYRQRYDVDIAPERIFLTPGASGALMLVLTSLLDAGDEVLLPDPGYPCNRHFVRALDGVPRSIPVSADKHFQLNADSVISEWGERTRLLMLASPANPTGQVLSPELASELFDAVSTRSGVMLVDEIYQGLTYDVAPFSSAAISDEIIIINSFSKYFGMTGWRLGWAIVPPELIDAAEKIAQNLFIAPSTPSQHAAMAAFDNEVLAELDKRRDAFKARRDILVAGLRKLGFSKLVVPDGAFYLYVDISHLGLTGEQLCETWLRELHIAITPGVDFGENNAERFVRFAFTTPADRINEALSRIGKWLDR